MTKATWALKTTPYGSGATTAFAYGFVGKLTGQIIIQQVSRVCVNIVFIDLS